MRRFTPLSYFPDSHAKLAMDELANFEQNFSYIVVCFDYLTRATVYAYDIQLLTDFTNWEDPPQVVYPRIKIEYELHPEDCNRWQSSGLRLIWSQSTLAWSTSRIGTLGFHQSFPATGGINCFISVSTLSLSSLETHHDSSASVPVEYKRYLGWAETSDGRFCRTEEGSLLMSSLGIHGINCIWALSHPGVRCAIKAVAIARFFTEDKPKISSKDCSCDAIPEANLQQEPLVVPESSSTEIDKSDLGLGKTVVNINLESWIPHSEKAEDICLDDRYGRVAVGTRSGKVFIFDFL